MCARAYVRAWVFVRAWVRACAASLVFILLRYADVISLTQLVRVQ